MDTGSHPDSRSTSRGVRGRRPKRTLDGQTGGGGRDECNPRVTTVGRVGGSRHDPHPDSWPVPGHRRPVYLTGLSVSVPPDTGSAGGRPERVLGPTTDEVRLVEARDSLPVFPVPHSNVGGTPLPHFLFGSPTRVMNGVS